ncbi:serine/threonine-protein phosphatase 7 long form-like protein [Cucumis melo var. makuwa]|uniref:Serine/threonine-protein phosphatase 7 long form-like protein n=1 Tax=Cucumis melo var. makuwa TaxID=1194695 RepID=A0A5A7TT22_CUCMM|nr:serine/threonine-protein phosphatase 7 long form-like protein [Cucumis melo var. makuwa]
MVILAAINNEEIGWSKPQAFHRYCLRHVASNFNNKYKSKQLKILVFRVDDQHQRHKFIRTMKELKKLNPECLEYFEDIDLQKWTQSHDNGYQYGWMASNAAECMNGVFKGARDPYITQHMRYLLHYRVELSEERGSVSTHHPLRPVHYTLLRCCWIPKGLPGWVHAVRLTFDYCIGRALETKDPHISHALWGVHDHAAGCCSAVRVASGWGGSDRIIEETLSCESCTVFRDHGSINATTSLAYNRFPIVAPQRPLQHLDGRLLSFRNRWSGALAASEQPANMFLTYRWTFDRLRQSQMNWTSYIPDIMASLPLRCRSGQALWTYVGPLIFFIWSRSINQTAC